MNYRQWKKKYKKIHGHNPTVSEDKRKKSKIVKKIINNVSEIDEETLKNVANNIVDVIASCFRCLGEAFISISNSLK